MVTHIVHYIFRMARPANLKLCIWMEDDDPQAPWPPRSKVMVARSRDQSEPSWPNAVPVIRGGGGIPWRPNPAVHFLLYSTDSWSCGYSLHRQDGALWHLPKSAPYINLLIYLSNCQQCRMQTSRKNGTAHFLLVTRANSMERSAFVRQKPKHRYTNAFTLNLKTLTSWMLVSFRLTITVTGPAKKCPDGWLSLDG